MSFANRPRRIGDRADATWTREQNPNPASQHNKRKEPLVSLCHEYSILAWSSTSVSASPKTRLSATRPSHPATISDDKNVFDNRLYRDYLGSVGRQGLPESPTGDRNAILSAVLLALE